MLYEKRNQNMAKKLADLLQQTAHRPWKMPSSPWHYYQEWNEALFLHFAVPAAEIEQQLPKGIELDVFEGQAYLSVVCFRMQNIRPRYLPAWDWLSDFYEINVRTYVKKDGKAGVYFLSIEAEKTAAAWLARTLSGLPYQKTKLRKKANTYRNTAHQTSLNVSFEPKEELQQPSPLELWLTERYCLYLDKKKKLHRYEIHHIPWPLQAVEINHMELDYSSIHPVLTTQNLHHAHYARGVKVIAWNSVPLSEITS